MMTESRNGHDPLTGGEGRRLRLPVAPRAQTGSRYPPAARPRPAMLPAEALAWLAAILAQGERIAAVEIGGPGDPLAVPEPTLLTLRLLRQQYPQLRLGLATAGLGGDRLAPLLAEIGLDEVTLLIAAVDAEIAAKIYAWIRPARQTMPLAQAIPLLLLEQARTVIALAKAGVKVTIQTTLHPGLNDAHLEQIAETMAGLGANKMILRPFLPPGEEENKAAAAISLARLRERASRHLPVSEYSPAEEAGPPPVTSGYPRPERARPNVAVASSSGLEIDLHLGQAEKLLILGPRTDGLLCLLESRPLPVSGGGGRRWEELAALLPDCFSLLAAQAGEKPRTILGELGIRVLLGEGGVAETVERLYGHAKKTNPVRC